MKTLKELQEALKAAHEKCDNAVKAADELKGKAASAKDEEEKKGIEDQLAVVKEELDKAKADFDKVNEQVKEKQAEADDREKRQKAIDLITSMSAKTEDTIAQASQTFKTADAEYRASMSAYTEAKDVRDRERAHVDALRAFLLDEEKGLPGEKQELLVSKSQSFDRSGQLVPRERTDLVYNSAAVLPKFLSRAMWEMAGAKTIYSFDNAVTNPSLANNLVPEEFRATLLQLPPPPATVLGMVTRFPTSTGSLTFPTLVQSDSNELGGMTWGWITESAEKPITEPVFGQLTVNCHELAGYTELSHKILIRSSIALEPLLAQLSRSGMSLELENVILNGAGDNSNQPLGIRQAVGVRTRARAAAGAVSYGDLKHLKHEIQFYHRDNANYILGDDVEEHLEDILDTTGRPIFAASVSSGPNDRLVGYPYRVSYNSPTLGNAADVIFGNFRQYYLVVEEDITIAKSDHYRFRHNVRAIKVFVNVGGRPAQPRAFAYLTGVDGS